jgi:putative two-component system response regulator
MDIDFLNAKILIIDDEQANILLLEDILDNEGYTQFKSLQDSRHALETYKQFRPDLVLLDLNMPHYDGFQVMEQLQEVEKETPTHPYSF